MTEEKRIVYVDCALRVNNIGLDKAIIKKILKVVDMVDMVDMVDKSKGKATLDEVLI